MTDRQSRNDYETNLFAARAYLTEARNRRLMGHRNFSITLLEWTGNARIRAVKATADEMPLFQFDNETARPAI